MKLVRILKKTGKIFLITLLSLILLVSIVFVIAINSENYISKIALKKVSEMFEAPVSVENVSLLLFKDFPFATLEFNNFKVGPYQGDGDFKKFMETNDTLLSFDKFYVSLKSKPLLKSIIEIEKIEIEGFEFNYIVDSAGLTNIDFLLTTDSTSTEEPTDTTSTLLDVLLKDLTLRDVKVNFSDDQLKAKATIHIPSLDLSGRVLNEYYAGTVNGSVVLSNASFDDTNLNLMRNAELFLNAKYDDGEVMIESLSVTSDGLKLNANGATTLGDSIYMDLAFNIDEMDFKELSKYAPAEVLNEYGLVDIIGKLNMQAKVKGYYFDTLLVPSVDAKISLLKGAIKTKDYPTIKQININGDISAPNAYDLSTVSVNFSNINIATDKSTFNLAINASNIDKPRYSISSSALINLDEFNKYLPDSTVEYISGSIGFSMSTKGVLPDNIGMENANYFLTNSSLALKLRNFSTALDSVNEIRNLSVDMNYSPSKKFSIKNLNLQAPGYNVAIENSSLVGTILGNLSDYDNMGMDIEQFFMQMGGNTLGGKAYIYGLNKPNFKLQSDINLVLDELRPYIPDTLVSELSGSIAFKVNTYGTVDLDSVEKYAMPIAFEQTALNVAVRDLKLSMPGDTLVKVDKLSLDFAMANDTMKINNFFARAHGIDLWVDSTQIWNVYKAFLLEQKDKTIIVNTNLKVSDIDYAMFEPFLVTDTTQVETVEEDTMYIPPYIVRGTMAANSVKYGNILLKDLSSKFRVDDSLYVIDDFKLSGFGGNMVTSLAYKIGKDLESTIEFKNEINGMDVRKLLVDGENFGQTDITYENVDGILTSSISGRVVMQDTNILYDKINILGYFKLENGGIYNFEPAMELSRYTNLRELNNIIFRTLESSVFIYNNRIFFPKTDIVSTAFDITAYGMESFGDEYEYHLVLHPGDAIFGKTEKLLKQQGLESDVFEGVDKAERKGLHLVAKKRDGDTKYGIDNKSMQRMMNAMIRTNERGLNLLFHPRLFNFSTEIERK